MQTPSDPNVSARGCCTPLLWPLETPAASSGQSIGGKINTALYKLLTSHPGCGCLFFWMRTKSLAYFSHS
ncbi:hypothetical protein PGIGA_G00096130, partial [Pangasianodon gigas]|nr:hypothetical protein [Pangasianodon gigas]